MRTAIAIFGTQLDIAIALLFYAYGMWIWAFSPLIVLAVLIVAVLPWALLYWMRRPKPVRFAHADAYVNMARKRYRGE